MKFIKATNGTLLTDPEDIKARWQRYYAEPMNEENPHPPIDGNPLEHDPNYRMEIPLEGVGSAMGRMTPGKACGPRGVPVDALKLAGPQMVALLWILFNLIAGRKKTPDTWRCSTVVAIYTQKGDILGCYNYRPVTLLLHVFKLWERVWERRARLLVNISPRKFGFMPGRSTTGATHLRTMSQEFRAKKASLWIVFVDLKKAFHRVPHKLLWWALRKRGVQKQAIELIQDMYAGSSKQVRTQVGTTGPFGTKVGVHQGSSLGPFLFIMVLGALSQDIEGGRAMDDAICRRPRASGRGTGKRRRSFGEMSKRFGDQWTEGEQEQNRVPADEHRRHNGRKVGRVRHPGQDGIQILGICAVKRGGLRS